MQLNIIDFEKYAYFLLGLWKYKGIWHDKEVLALNNVGIPVPWQDKQIWQNMEAWYHTQYIV